MIFYSSTLQTFIVFAVQGENKRSGLVVQTLKPALAAGEQVPVQWLELAGHMVGSGGWGGCSSQSDPQRGLRPLDWIILCHWWRFPHSSRQRFAADHPCRRVLARIALSKVTTAYLALQTSFLTELLPSGKRVHSALAAAVGLVVCFLEQFTPVQHVDVAPGQLGLGLR